MIAATVSNAQLALKSEIERTRALVQDNVQLTKEAAAEAYQVKATEVKEGVGQLLVSLSMVAPLVILLAAVLFCSHVSFEAIGRMMSVLSLAVVTYVVLGVFGPKQAE